MVNPHYTHALLQNIEKNLGKWLAGKPEVRQIGVAMDHYKGLSSRVRAELIPFFKEKYEATEFLFGSIPLANPPMSNLYFQTGVLAVRGDSVPTNIQFAAAVPSPIPESIVTPLLLLSSRFLAVSAVGADAKDASVAYKKKLGWSPMLEALNNDKNAVHVITWGGDRSASVGNYRLKLGVNSPTGYLQLAPYRGFTVLTAQRSAAPGADVNLPKYNFTDVMDGFARVLQVTMRFPESREEIGKQFVNNWNAPMMEMLFSDLDARVGAFVPRAPAPAAFIPGPSDRVPCPICAQPVQPGWKFCPACRQALVWS